LLEWIGDWGVMARCSDEDSAARWAAAVRQAAPPWLLDVVQAYTTVAVYFQRESVDPETVWRWLETVTPADAQTALGRTYIIPVCYELGPDLDTVARHTGLSVDGVVQLHTAQPYRVYAIGFCPGFPYLGYLPERLSGIPRRDSPRLRVEPGSVGLTGRQTGIYTEPRPGGWALIGQTPLILVDVAAEYFPLRTGDCVQFVAIDRASFRSLKGQRLEPAPV
ncbi:MAG: allophanate hydrolase subunit 1, partial [Gemmataceae bacterium]